MDTKNILPRITASIHCPVIKLEKILFARFHTCVQISDRFFRVTLRTLSFFICCRSFSFCKKDVAGEYKANGYIHCSSQKSHGDGHCGRNNVIDSVLQYAEYRIDYFSRLNVKRLRPFHNFRIVSEYIVDPFLENRIFSSIFFAMFTNVAPSSGTTTSITITIILDHKADRKHQD